MQRLECDAVTHSVGFGNLPLIRRMVARWCVEILHVTCRYSLFSVMVVSGLKGIGYGINIIVRSLRACCKMITVVLIDYRLQFNVYHDTKIERKAIRFISFQLRKVGYGLVHNITTVTIIQAPFRRASSDNSSDSLATSLGYFSRHSRSPSR